MVTEVHKFLGFTGYYQYFIKDYSKIACPLLDLMKKTTPWHWTAAQQGAFKDFCDKMCRKPVLQQLDFAKPFFVHTDASANGVGAILLQEGEPNPSKPQKLWLHPVAYYSATFTPTEKNYDIYEQELLAALKAFRHWRPYLAWMKEPFTLVTDHANLLYWKLPRKLKGRLA
jgi:RNase H-like domain found in reverse transcriptase